MRGKLINCISRAFGLGGGCVNATNAMAMVEAAGVEPASGNIPLRRLHVYPDI